MNVIKNILTASLLLASIGTSVAQTGKTYLNVETSQGQFRSFEVTPELQVKMRKDGDRRYLDVLNPLFGGNKSYEVNSVLNVYWGDKQENDVNPTVSTVAAGSITGTSATLNGNVTDFGGTNLNGYGFKWGTTDNPDTDLTANLSGSSLTATLSGLSLGTTYYYRAYANNGTGTGWGDVLSFTTLNVPTLADGTATDVKLSEATLSGSYTSDGGGTVTSYGFEYGTTTSYGNSKSVAVGGTSFSATLTELQRNTTYYWRSFAENEAGKGYGAGSTFLTDAENPTVTTGAASNITTGGATLSGTLTDDGGAAITSAAFEYGPTAEYGSTATATINGNAFSATLSGLAKGTTYYYRVKATNNRDKTGYGEQGSFTTISAVVPTVTVQASLSRTSLIVTVTVTDTGGADITEIGVKYGIDTNNLNRSQKQTGNKSFAQFDIFDINASPYAIYYFQGYATNSAGTGNSEKVHYQIAAPPAKEISH
ncbi:MAG: fibronectin type III domain-containing protein [Bacteroidaceae bacterium]|nr:fibronectin type III domain-containing protein [Bacteroidaceae bacterium]